MRIEKDNQTLPFDSLTELRSKVQAIRADPFVALWVFHESGESMGLFLNGDRAWVSSLDANGDPHATSRSTPPAPEGSSFIDFRLENGQVDEVDAAWVVPGRSAVVAFLEFCELKRLSHCINWHEDS